MLTWLKSVKLEKSLKFTHRKVLNVSIIIIIIIMNIIEFLLYARQYTKHFTGILSHLGLTVVL